jgi:hypothetical protein
MSGVVNFAPRRFRSRSSRLVHSTRSFTVVPLLLVIVLFLRGVFIGVTVLRHDWQSQLNLPIPAFWRGVSPLFVPSQNPDWNASLRFRAASLRVGFFNEVAKAIPVTSGST